LKLFPIIEEVIKTLVQEYPAFETINVEKKEEPDMRSILGFLN